ncbi:DEAD/DEAH box helicase [Lentzea sp. BCCO 10_0856]|uniref:DEAD/DEAH box helicase n=1 Tax=Lentzea miocenica TaxID=3095431 RepID=A0ABU4T7G4_9PSEU|nr:DEAD/DEAH box helicase [Lentzea sp. BCCO 10_0856]MDX8034111.1 DEAD/DEAH box helicase [Lentzea sp. BCCO 10_0856]
MLVLHGLCTTDGVLALWAEDSVLPARSESARRDAPHPFAATAESLAAALGQEAPKTITRALLLPSFSSGPMASPELVRDPLATGRAQRGKVQLRQWGVPTIRFTARPEPAAEVRLSDSARFVFDVAGFAADLVDRGRVLPSVAADQAVARWVPVLSGTDSARFAALQAAMPPACRCEEIVSDPAELVRAALTTAVDEQVRDRLDGTGLAPKRRGRETTAEAWLAALTGEPAFDADPVELYELREQLDRWRQSAGNESPVRTCFRLRSPEQRDEDEWAIEFLLQAVDEPSVLVPAAQVWFADDGVLRRWIPAPQEHLLADLGRASRLHPDLDEALRGSHPAEMEVDAEGAYRFLTAAPVLAQAGFGVLLPSWWQQTTKLGLKLSTKSRGTAGTVAKESEIGLKSIVDYKWELALGEDALTDAELAELARAKVPLVKVRGQWVQVDQKRLAAGLAFLKRGGGQMTAAEVMLHSGFTEEDESLPLPLISVEADGWLGDLLSGKADEQIEPVEPPANFLARLRPYQQRGLAWLAFLDKIGLGACLADDMGLGKTVQLLALEALNRSHGKRPPTLLICPMSVVGNWQREAARFTPELSVHVHHGADRLDGDALREAVESHDLVLTTYALAARDADALGDLTWDRVVLDEAQNIKNSATRQSQAVRQLKARHRVALTGTPVENRLAELWSIMDFANPGVLGTVNTFRARFAVPVERHNDQDAAARLRKITNPFVLRRVKTDPRIISDLPDKVEMRQLCNLTTEQASLYQAVVNDMLEKIEEAEGIGRKGLVLATMSKLKQVCNHPAHFLGDGSRIAGRSGKLARLEEVLEEVLAEGDKALCFTQFTAFGSMLVPYLAARFDTEVMFLHGGTNKAARDRMVERFQDSSGPSLFLLSLKAGGTGLNLTAANHVIHLDRWWNPAVEDQATDRAFRIGQRRNVQVRKFVCIGTLEERIDAMIEEKRALAQLVVGAGENWLTELSTSQLRDLLTLSGEAIGE